MSPDLDRLIRLQQIDTAIADARARIAAHPRRVAEADAKLGEAALALEAARARLAANQEERRARERDMTLYQGRLDKFKDQQAAVKTNKEYQALGHEIETAQRELAAAEEKVIERMVEADALTAQLREAEAQLARRTREVDAEKQALDRELAELEASLTRATAARAALVAELDAQLVALFTQVAKVRKGVALCAATLEGLCSVCHVRLRPHVFQQVRHNDTIIQCESCQRILYYVPPPPPVEAPAVHTR